MSKTRALVAANVRARIGWQGLTVTGVARSLGIRQQTMSNKISGYRRFTDDELMALAVLFKLPDPGPLFRVPEEFGPMAGEITEEQLSAWTRITGALTWPDVAVAS